MEYFSRGFKSVLGKVESEGPSGAETVCIYNQFLIFFYAPIFNRPSLKRSTFF